MSEKFNSTWEKEGNPFKGKISKAAFLSAWDEYQGLNPIGSKNDFIKWLVLEKYPDIFTTVDNSSMIRKRDSEKLDIYSVEKQFGHLFSKRESEADKEQKQKLHNSMMEHLAERKRQWLANGGTSEHLVAGRKHQIDPYDGKFPKQKDPHRKVSSDYRVPKPTYTGGEKAQFIRNMSRDLRETPFRKWTINQMEFAKMFPSIANKIRQYQENKKPR